MVKFHNVFKTFWMIDLHLTLVASLQLAVQLKQVYRLKAFTHDNII